MHGKWLDNKCCMIGVVKKRLFVCLFSFLEMKYRIVDNAVIIRGNDKISILKINCKIKRLICNYHIYIVNY